MTTTKKSKKPKEEPKAEVVELAEAKPETVNDVPALFENDQVPPEVFSEPLEIDPYRGIAKEPFPRKTIDILLDPINPKDVEIRPDGIIYYPEIKYRRVLNQAFGPGGWALQPRGEYTKMGNTLTRCYALIVAGRFVSEAQGEMEYIENNSEMTWATCAEGAKSNALMRCCKDIGIASECWDPVFIDRWLKENAVQVWRAPKAGKPTRPQWRRKDRDPFYDETGLVGEERKAQSSPYQPETFSHPESPTPRAQPQAQGKRKFPKTEDHVKLRRMIKAHLENAGGQETATEEDILRHLTAYGAFQAKDPKTRQPVWLDKEKQVPKMVPASDGVTSYDEISPNLAKRAVEKFEEWLSGK